MDLEQKRKEHDEHFKALSKLDIVTLIGRGRRERARAFRIILIYAARGLSAFAGLVSSRIASALRPGELTTYDERLLRDMGISRYDVATHRTGTVAKWLDRSRQRKRLAMLSERELRDIAITRCDAQAEVAKPFWRA